MSLRTDPWHYPRGELVEQVIKTASFGLIHRLAMFAPRRKGKTAFLLQDLAPAAAKRQILPIYASLWANAMESFIRSLLLRRSTTSAHAIEEVMIGIGNDPQYLSRWQGLRAIDQLVYLNICDGGAPFAADIIKQIGAALNRETVHVNQVQRAVKRLTDVGLISSNRQREYQNEDHDFLAWIRYRQDHESKNKARGIKK